jgi:glucosamine--fructose-6-phosphate aminotransferase (isomerizing)
MIQIGVLLSLRFGMENFMCGIVGYIGKKQAAPILLNGLSSLEYRGYDSAGIAVRDGDGDISVTKAKGRLKALAEKIDNGKAVKGCCGIGHTRWATHGAPSETNAHPHTSNDCSVVAVHNGIIENYQELKDKLTHKGYTFYSQTDTEIAVNLIDYYYKKYKVGPIDAIAKTMVRVRGSYALAVMFKDYPGEIYVARKDSPMIIGVTDKEVYVASDVPAILNYTRTVYYIDNLEMGRLTPGKAEFYNLDGDIVDKTPVEITWDAKSAEKGGFEHFMMKEIHEQPKAVSDTFHAYLNGDTEKANSVLSVDLSKTGLTDEDMKNFSQIHIVACGSAYHVGVVAQYVIEDLVRIPVRVELASEFRYRNPILSKDELVIIVSQSGETADSLAALREAKKLGVKTLAIVNVIGSSIAREADYVMYTYAGPEISVATTKAYSTQLIASYMLALGLAKSRNLLTDTIISEMLYEINDIPAKIQHILEDKERIQWFASKYSNVHDVFFIGRGIDYAICLEGSLKMKEISYIHSEAYAAGELKHGTISLIEDGTLVIGVLSQSELYEKTLSNLVEVKSRGAYLMGLALAGNYNIEDTANFTVFVPKTDEHFTASLAVIPLQLLGYYISVARGLDVDKPRNLAKSVTVE